jgi:hypothetical protein
MKLTNPITLTIVLSFFSFFSSQLAEAKSLLIFESTQNELSSLDWIDHSNVVETSELNEAGKMKIAELFVHSYSLKTSTNKIIHTRGIVASEKNRDYLNSRPEKVDYSDVKVKNNTPYPVKVKVYYADLDNWLGISLCKNDTKTIQPFTKWSQSRGSCLITKITATVYEGSNEITASSYTSSGTGYHQFAVLPRSGGRYKVYRTGADWDKQITDAVSKTFNETYDLLYDGAKRAQNAATAVVNASNAMAEQGIATTSEEFTKLSKQAENQLKYAVEFVEETAKYAYEWAEKNACQLAVTTAISMGVVAYFTPKPSPTDPGTVTSTSMSAAFLAFVAGKLTKYAASQTMALAATESFMLIPGVAGNVNKKMLHNCIANAISSSMDCTPCWGTPAGVGIAIGAGVAPIVAEYVCSGIMPTGYKNAKASAGETVVIQPSDPSLDVPGANSYRVQLDYCHTNLTHEGTSGTITCEFWSNGKKVTTRTKRPIAECTTSGADAEVLNFVAGSTLPITHAIIRTNSGNAFYIDAVKIYRNGSLNKSYGGENGKGWCISTDAGDANGAWSSYIGNYKCTSTQRFNLVVPPVYSYKVEIDHCADEVTHEGTSGMVSVQFMNMNKTVGVKGMAGISNSCASPVKTFTITSESNVSHIIVKNTSGNAFYIDEIRLYKDGKLIKEYGKGSTKGFCLSTDAGDAYGAWKNYIEGPTCTSTRQFMYFMAF